MVGKKKSGALTEDEKVRVNTAVERVEKDTGLEFCVIVGSTPHDNPRRQAEMAFHKLGMHERPGVMIMVVPQARTLEVLTAPDIADRLTDRDCEEAVQVMTGLFATSGVVDGLERGMYLLAERAGSDGTPDVHEQTDLPNIVDLDDPNLN